MTLYRSRSDLHFELQDTTREPAGFEIVETEPRRVAVVSADDGTLIGYATIDRDRATMTLHIPIDPRRRVVELACGGVSIGYSANLTPG